LIDIKLIKTSRIINR